MGSSHGDFWNLTVLYWRQNFRQTWGIAWSWQGEKSLIFDLLRNRWLPAWVEQVTLQNYTQASLWFGPLWDNGWKTSLEIKAMKVAIKGASFTTIMLESPLLLLKWILLLPLCQHWSLTVEYSNSGLWVSPVGSLLSASFGDSLREEAAQELFPPAKGFGQRGLRSILLTLVLLK